MWTSLLSLLPPSCMVVPIRDLGNITSNTLTIHETTLSITANEDVVMVVDLFDQLFQDTNNNFDEVRDHSLAHCQDC